MGVGPAGGFGEIINKLLRGSYFRILPYGDLPLTMNLDKMQLLVAAAGNLK